jgi:outer membrane protein OmpA-like peptidoglycan-associated protein
MALPKENPSNRLPMEGLLDLLTDLNILNPTQKPSKESLTSNQNALSQDEDSSSQVVEKRQDSDSHAAQTVEAESADLTQPQLTETSAKETTNQPTESPHPVAAEHSFSNGEELLNQRSGPYQQQAQPEASKNPPDQTPEDLKPHKPLDTPAEQVFNRLIKSHWQNTQRQAPTSQSSRATDEQTVENSLELFERWQRLLLTQEVMDSRELLTQFKEKLATLEHQIYEPKEFINLLLPLITEVLSLKIAESREEVAQAIAPAVDEMIQHRTQQNKAALSSALAPVLPEAVAQQVSNSPGEFAKALGPEMGTAIKEQISLERDAMVDALYPVIGSTISKYMAEAIRTINEKVENTLSLEGISRKIRAKMQGVSEAELILKEAIPFTVKAIFLIHKASGLVISEVQPSESQRLESDMVAGMLTAIRSFANDCIAQSGEASEIENIDYGNFQITLEVAGYCYLAIVTQGKPHKSFTRKMHRVLVTIVQKQGKAIELFDGDPTNVPEQVHQSLQDLTTPNQTSTEGQKPKPPATLLLISLAVLGTTSLALGTYQYRNSINHHVETQTSLALASDPELAIYRLTVEANHKTLKLSGQLPNQYLRSKAEQIAQKVEPKLKINNAIIPVEVPPDPVAAQAEVKRVTDILNQMAGAVISADYSEGKVTVEGAVLQQADAMKITQAFLEIPGVKAVTNTVQLQPLAIASRIYFDQGSSELKSTELSKIIQLKAFVEQYPNKHLKVVGHTDPRGTATENQQLALERAKRVRDMLVSQGVDSNRVQAEGTTNLPLGVDAAQIPLLSRCVEFEMIEP